MLALQRSIDVSGLPLQPQYTSIPTNPNQKNENFHEKNKMLRIA
jgi:hypothetical protein